jgi:hypothetical protein
MDSIVQELMDWLGEKTQWDPRVSASAALCAGLYLGLVSTQGDAGQVWQAIEATFPAVIERYRAHQRLAVVH